MLKTKVSVENSNSKMVADVVFSFLAGIFLSDAQIGGAVSFINVSIVGAVTPLSAVSVLVGSLMKYIATSQVHKNIILICAMTFIVIGKLIVSEKCSAKYVGLSTSIATFASGVIVATAINEGIFKIVYYLIYSVLAGFTAYFIRISTESLRNSKAVDLKSARSCAYAIVFVVIISSLASFEPVGLNMGRFVGIVVTLVAAKHYGYIGGVLCGALTTCGVFLSSSESGLTVVLLSVAGLLTGYFNKNSTFIISAFFAAINIIFMIFMGFPSDMLNYIIEMFMAIAVFNAVSPFFTDKWFITGKNDSGVGDVISSQMSFLANSISAVRSDSKRISDYLSAVEHKDFEIEKISDTVCSHCYNRLSCWYNKYEATRTGFKKMSEIGDPDVDKIPYELSECVNKERLALEFSKNYREKVTARLMSLRLSDSQKMLFEQIKITEEIVASVGEKIDIRYSESISKAVKAKLEKFSFYANNVIAYYNSENRLLTELYFAADEAPKNCERICDLISDEVKLNIDFSEPVYSGKEVRIRVFEKTPYSLETYRASMCAPDSTETGDSTAVFSDGVGNSYIILSDGMGSGRNAALDSKMVVSMFKKLIISGAEYSSAIKLINSIMLTKSQDESFATLDAVKINLDSCQLTVIKSGASATLIRHRGQVIKISSPTFPIGIVEEADTYARKFEFEDGDIIIMFSDGINENEYLYIKELLLKSDNIRDIVDDVCRKADLFDDGTCRDDVTVIGLRVTLDSHSES